MDWTVWFVTVTSFSYKTRGQSLHEWLQSYTVWEAGALTFTLSFVVCMQFYYLGTYSHVELKSVLSDETRGGLGCMWPHSIQQIICVDCFFPPEQQEILMISGMQIISTNPTIFPALSSAVMCISRIITMQFHFRCFILGYLCKSYLMKLKFSTVKATNFSLIQITHSQNLF